ncbi:adenylate/guanylate cyclase domain-containing protein [Candidatus Peregrinibacteria bacterium]|nr:adenylate/guanylate cyclase domain-containing protein [Candidatus Peregrinibacteria bacterium]
MISKIIKFIGLSFFILALTALMVNQGWFMSLQTRVQNVYYDYDQASPQIVVIAIDEKSLQENELGPLQKWPRQNYAEAVRILNEKGAAVVGVDVLFPDKSVFGVNDDLILAGAIGEYPNTVLALRYDFDRDGNRFVEGPNTTLTEANPKLGWINVMQDTDGFVRKLPVFAATSTSTVEAFSVALARLYLKSDIIDYRAVGNEWQFSDKIVIPTVAMRDPYSKRDAYLMNINYFAQPKSYTTVSMADLLKGKPMDGKGKPVDFTGKIALIGPTAKGLGDSYLSPVSEGVQMPGVEIHANNVQTIIEGKFLRDQSRMSFWLTLIILAVINVMLFAFLKVRYALFVALAEMIGMVVAGIVAYDMGVLLNVVHPDLLILFCFTGAYLLRFILEQKQRRFIEGAFGRYVNKTVIAQIIRNPELLKLGGQTREITVFFSDIEGFTTLSEKMKPEELVSFLNEYLGVMTESILKNEGTLDKYEGDAIMAFWGAPIPVSAHAKNACLAALENQKKLGELRKKWNKAGLPELRIRIGMNTGNAVVGNMGSANRFNYTAMGDNVNLASRLEGINKEYGTGILISEPTYVQVKDDFICREMDLIRVKGKEKPVRIYELMGKKGEVKPEIMALIGLYETALKLYREKNFMAASQKFAELAEDIPSRVFAKRCQDFMQNPPPEGWDGVYTFMTK